ncbi:hypothetical protein E2C01_015407 [Portunus trituberculatus]|uniref:Uncharacterized protein n=1 Tax=Portunus trituberculatus TaxID=210409 RepID=A0A5B7DMX0_PORTR|nr:hypothetical protein [Portunus trituberculatus]
MGGKTKIAWEKEGGSHDIEERGLGCAVCGVRVAGKRFVVLLPPGSSSGAAVSQGKLSIYR